MEILSKYFGKTEISEETIITMIQPVYGFEQADAYTILTDSELGSDIMWFQSIHHPEICFILANPEAFALRKPEAFSQEVLTMLSVPSKEDLDVAYLLSVTDTLEQATVNLKSPIVFNPHTRQGAQIILNEDLPLREGLFASC